MTTKKKTASARTFDGDAPIDADAFKAMYGNCQTKGCDYKSMLEERGVELDPTCHLDAVWIVPPGEEPFEAVANNALVLCPNHARLMWPTGHYHNSRHQTVPTTVTGQNRMWMEFCFTLGVMSRALPDHVGQVAGKKIMAASQNLLNAINELDDCGSKSLNVVTGG